MKVAMEAMRSTGVPLRVLEFYSGIGGMHYSLLQSGVPAVVVEAFDINDIANDVYMHNFGKRPNQGNVQRFSAQDFDKYAADVWLMSPPCQPYTRQGLKKDAADGRAMSFLGVLDKFKEMKSPPSFLFVENVVGFETSVTHEFLMEVLHGASFTVQEFILSPIQFGIPYSRPRYFCLARRYPHTFAAPELSAQLNYTCPPINLCQDPPPANPETASCPQEPLPPVMTPKATNEYVNGMTVCQAPVNSGCPSCSQSHSENGGMECLKEAVVAEGPERLAACFTCQRTGNVRESRDGDGADLGPERLGMTGGGIGKVVQRRPVREFLEAEEPTGSMLAGAHGECAHGTSTLVSAHHASACAVLMSELHGKSAHGSLTFTVAQETQSTSTGVGNSTGPPALSAAVDPTLTAIGEDACAAMDSPLMDGAVGSTLISAADGPAQNGCAHESATLTGGEEDDVNRSEGSSSEDPPAGSDSCRDDVADRRDHKWREYWVPDDVIFRFSDAMDIVTEDSMRCCCFTKSYFRYVKGTGSVLATKSMEAQGMERGGEVDGQSGPTLENGVPLLSLGLRYFTPREVANIHSLPPTFEFPPHVTLRQRYALLGNSLSIAVVAPLLRYLLSSR